jgi:hypothetical protein
MSQWRVSQDDECGTDHLVGESGDEVAEEGSNRDTKLLPHVTSTPPQHPSQDVSPSYVAGYSTVADGKGEGPDVIGDDPVRSVDTVGVLLAELPGVRSRTRELLDASEEGHEDVRIVVGSLVLEDGDESLESHSSVDVLRGESAEGRVGLAVVLDEDEVPDLREGNE